MNIDGIDYKKDINGQTWHVAKYRGNADNVVIPSTLQDGCPVTVIGENAFYHSEICSIVIPEGVSEICRGAFDYCVRLTSIVLPNTLKIIEDCAFQSCNALIRVHIPASVYKIGSYDAFTCKMLEEITVDENNQYFESEKGALYTKGLEELVLCPAKAKGLFTVPKGVQRIRDHAFYFCTDLTGINLPDTLISIGSTAFWRCESLNMLEIPDSVTDMSGETIIESCLKLESVKLSKKLKNVGPGLFSRCKNLMEIIVSEESDFIFSDGALLSKDKKILYYCLDTHGGTYTVPPTVTEIKKWSFHYLDSIIIPNSVRSIDSMAFGSKVKYIEFQGTKEEWCSIYKSGDNNPYAISTDTEFHFPPNKDSSSAAMLNRVDDGAFVILGCYSRKGTIALEIVKEVLEANHIRALSAFDSIFTNSVYASEREEVIKNCAAYILVFSYEAFESKRLEKELKIALDYNKAIIPFQIKESELNYVLNLSVPKAQRHEACLLIQDRFQQLIQRLKSPLLIL